MEKLVSVIVPVYNSEKWLNRCLDSICSQVYSNLEVILVNDGSTDNSLNICKKYASEYENFIIVDKKNSGVSHSRNIGISKASGHFLCFIDSDDEVKETFISDMISAYNKIEADLICTDFDVINFDGKEKRVKLFDNEKIFVKDEFDILYELFIRGTTGVNNVWNKMFKISIIKNNDIMFDESISHSEDMAFVLDYLNNSKSFYYLPKNNYIYHFNESSLTRKFDYNQLKNHMLWKKILYDYIPLKLLNKNLYYLNKLSILEIKSFLCNAVINKKEIDYESIIEYMDVSSLIRKYKLRDFKTLEEKIFLLTMKIKKMNIFMFLFGIKLMIKRS